MALAPGLLWLRLQLPFRLNHVNIYLLEDDDSWTVIDAGVDDPGTRGVWETVLAEVLGGRPIRRIVVTHYHPDHVGAAAFLAERTGATVLMGETEYLTARAHLAAGDADLAAEEVFYRGHGLADAAIGFMRQRLARYRRVVPALPRRYQPLRAGDRLVIGARRLDVLCHAGHSPAQMLLHAPGDNLFFAADHVLAQISPNVSVAEEKPHDDPLGLYLASFPRLRETVSDEALVLPGHRLPFRGLHTRTRQLALHHDERCGAILAACRARPLTAADLVPALFPMDLDPHQLWFAFSEALAHVNYLSARGRLVEIPSGGISRWQAP
jgi:glyoxylase-like metal-dependent hydrolase (beta-lactamase superfamily II)